MICPDVYHTAKITRRPTLVRVPRLVSSNVLSGRCVNKWGRRQNTEIVPKRTLSSFASKNFRSLTISIEYDCTCRVNHRQNSTSAGRVCYGHTWNSAKPSRASLIFVIGVHSKIHFGQSALMRIPAPKIATERLKLRSCPGDTSSSSQFIWRPKPAAEIVVRAA